MALEIKKSELPGSKTFKKIYDLIPGGGTVKAIVVGLGIAGVIVAAISLGAVGIIALVGLCSGSLLGASLLAAGCLAGLGALCGLLGKAIPQLYSFNWAVSDKEIDAAFQNSLNGIYGQLGEAAGSAVGWTVCGILPGALTFCFNPAVAQMVMVDLAEEAKEEVWGNIAACKQSAVAMLANAMLMQGFKNARKWVKKPDSPFYKFLKDHFGERFTKWGDEGQPSFSFASKAEKMTEAIKDPGWRNFTEEFLESLVESCSDALNRVSDSVRTQMSAYALMRKHEEESRSAATASQNMVVQLDFSRDDDDSTPAPAT